jgi:ABC-type Fe3+/spermidine/putrescine transport system ATPase subunit
LKSEIGAPVLLSLRPETLRLSSPDSPLATRDSCSPNSLRGRILDTTYLGELAQHTVELAGQVRVKVAALNPAAAHPPAGSPISLTIDPSDVVVLPAE